MKNTVELPESIIQERRRRFVVRSDCFSGCAAGSRLLADKRITRLPVVLARDEGYTSEVAAVGGVVGKDGESSLSLSPSRLPTATTTTTTTTSSSFVDSLDR